MSDDIKPADLPEVMSAPAVPAATAASPPTNPAGGLLDGDDGADDAPVVSPTTWPSDWRERWAGGDEQALKSLKRWASPDNVFKSWLDLRKKMGAGQLAPALPEGADEGEVASYRKAAGIPESPDGYEIAFPEGVEAGETQLAQLAAFKQAMHGANIPPAHVKAAFDTYIKIQQEEGQRQYDTARQAVEDGRVELRSEYGRDFTRNLRIANNLIAEHAGEKAPELMALRLADGRALGAHPDFVRFVVAAALATAGDDTLVASETAPGGKTLDEQIKEEMALQHSDPRVYHTAEHEARRLKLFAARQARDERQGRAA